MADRKHVFFCLNQKEAGKPCCAIHDAESHWLYMRDRVALLGLAGKEGIRVNKAGCLGHCSEGPAIVIYPEGTWYRYDTTADLDEIIESHLLKDQIVTRLVIPSERAQ